jgi:hypothetical protein
MPTTQAAQGLGRVYDVIAQAGGVYFSLKNANAVSFVVVSSGTSSLALVGATTYAAGTNSTWTTAHGFGQTGFWYQNTVATGTAAWTKQTSVWTTNSIALAGTTAYVGVITVYATQFADGYSYIKATGTSTTTVTAILHDLAVARTPANLAILGA